MVYTSREIERVARVGFDVARKRRKQADLGRQGQRADRLAALARRRHAASAKDYPDVTLEHVLVDNCAMALVQKPTQLRHASSPRTPSATSCPTRRRSWSARMGMLPSASLGGEVGALRAGARDGAGHRGPGHRQPDRGRFCPRRCCCGTRWTCGAHADRDRRRGAARARAGLPDARHRARRGRRWSAPPRWATSSCRSWRRAPDGDGSHDRGGRRHGRGGQTTLKILEERKFPVRELPVLRLRALGGQDRDVRGRGRCRIAPRRGGGVQGRRHRVLLGRAPRSRGSTRR